MKKWAVTACLFLFLALIVVIVRKPIAASATSRDVETLRIRRLEIVDPNDRVTATLEYNNKASSPMLSFFNQSGHESMRLVLNQSGQASMYFIEKNGGPTVSVGYLAAGDVQPEEGEKGFKGSWGLQVHAAGKVKSFDSLSLDPATTKQIQQSIKPLRIPTH